MYILKLNDLRAPAPEINTSVARSEDPQKLLDFLASERVPTYFDEVYTKTFRKEGPLEWFHEPIQAFGQGVSPVKSVEEQVAAYQIFMEDWWVKNVTNVPDVDTL